MVIRYAVVGLKGKPMMLLDTPKAATNYATKVMAYKYKSWPEMLAAGYRLAKFEVREAA